MSEAARRPLTPAHRWEVAKAILAGVLFFATYFLPAPEGVRWFLPLVPLAAGALLLVPPSRRRDGEVKLAIVASLLATVMTFTLVRFAANGGFMMPASTIQYGGGAMVVGFLMIAALVLSPIVGAAAAFAHAWSLLRPTASAPESRRRSGPRG